MSTTTPPPRFRVTNVYASVYGPVGSEIPLPLPLTSQPARLLIETGAGLPAPPEYEAMPTGRRCFQLSFPSEAVCNIDLDKSKVIVYPCNRNPSSLGHMITDHLLSRLAGERMYCLHAAAVSVDGRAHVLVGASGAGKSTLSIRLARNGAQLLGDDCAAILAGWVYPTYRPGRVWPASLVRLGLQEMSPDASGKVLLDERHGVRIARSPVPLATVVLVGTRPRCLALDEALHVIVGQRFHLSLRPPRVLFDEGVRLLRESGPINEIDRDSWLPLGDPRMGSRCLTNANQSVLNQVIDEP